MNPIQPAVMVLIGVIVGECIIRLCRRLPAMILETNVYPGSTLLALAAGRSEGGRRGLGGPRSHCSHLGRMRGRAFGHC